MHTPGPWELGEDRRGTLRVFANECEIVRALSKHGLRRLPAAERYANARLIAAAPDLLAALGALTQGYQYLSGKPPSQKELWDDAFAAVAKAKAGKE